jgi:DNA-binding transcriptional MerR regulator
MYTIQQVAKMFNITTNKIRFYEEKGLIKPIRNEDNEYRYFKDEDLVKLQSILLYRVLGLSIEDIKEILSEDHKKNYLDHFYKQWQIVNDEIHRLLQIRTSLEEIIDNIYEDTDTNKELRILKVVSKTSELNTIKNQWVDKWDFNSWAKTYDKAVEEDKGQLKMYKNYNSILEEVYNIAIKNTKEAPSILEIGVGTGNLANKFFREGYNIVGIDQSREMLNVAKEKNPRLKVRLGEFLKIPFDNKVFDVIVSTYAFHHLKDNEKVVAIGEMIRVLKDHGKIVIGDLMFKSEEDKDNILKGLAEDQVKEIQDEYYSNIDFLQREFGKCNKTLKYTQVDYINYIIEVI